MAELQPISGGEIQAVAIETAINRTSNCDILDDEAPNTPTLRDIVDGQFSRKSTTMQKLYNFSDSVTKLPEAFWIMQSVHYAEQFANSLPNDVDGSRAVYLITKTNTDRFLSMNHWSIYSQGHFFHLSADVPKNPLAQSDPSAKCFGAGDIASRVKDEDMTNIDSEAYLNASRDAFRRPYSAYQVGKTRYSPAQILRICEWVVRQLGKYDLLWANCQAFTTVVLDRIIMTKRDSSLFIGGKTQLVDWDMASARPIPPDSIPYSWDRGFLIRRPVAFRSWRARWPMCLVGAIGLDHERRSIRTLYERGPLAIGAQDPTGSRSSLRFSWHLFALAGGDLVDTCKDLGTVSRHLVEDLAAHRWEDAFRGRVEDRNAIDSRPKRCEIAYGIASPWAAMIGNRRGNV